MSYPAISNVQYRLTEENGITRLKFTHRAMGQISHDAQFERGWRSFRMKNLFEAAMVEEVKERMAQLRPESERLWGKMNAAQSLAHCSAAMKMATGKIYPPRILIGRLLGRLAKKSLIVNGTRCAAMR